jgi:hypothetical protein
LETKRAAEATLDERIYASVVASLSIGYGIEMEGGEKENGISLF